MSDVYIIRNQHQLYLDKQGNWVDGSHSLELFRTSQRDEAINTKVELSVRHPELRLTLITGVLDERGHLALASNSLDSANSVSFTPSREAESAAPVSVSQATVSQEDDETSMA
jgi:hypothetical protein